jgi:hypothetical protein
MLCCLGKGSRRLLAIAAGVLYATVLFAASFEHHDVVCHLLHPQHCTACSVSQLSCDPQTLAAPRTFQLVDAGRAITIQVLAIGALLPVRSPGRSPPSSV